MLKKGISWVFLLVLSLAAPTFAHAQSVRISTGLAWLSSSQTTTGYWPGVETSEYYATAHAIDAVYALAPSSPAYASGLDWISGKIVSPTDYLSRRILALKRAGRDVSVELETLLLYRNATGGWGNDSWYGDDILDTILALQALRAADYDDFGVLGHALSFILASQNTDNGWGFYNKDKSNAYSTALVLKTLAQYRTTFNLESSIAKAASYLAGKQNPDGGFGSSPTTVHETSLAFQALLESGQGGLPSLQNATSYLASSQAADGSWNGDAFSTALALQALAKVKPNLAVVPADITYSPAIPTINDSISLSAVIRNNGLEDAANVPVSFYDGDPAGGGVLIGQTVVTTIAAGGSGLASIAWSPATAGAHALFVVADPAGTVSEPAKSDNSAVAEVRVYEKIDLTVQQILFIPDLPGPGQSVDAVVKVGNQGGLPAQNIVVRLSVDGVPVQDKTIALVNSLQTQAVTFTLQNLSMGVHQVSAAADPDDLITEGTESNNALELSLEIKNRIDLSANSSGIHFSSTSAKEGETVHIAAQVFNLRENDAQNVVVRFYDGNPASGGTQIGADQTLPLVAGLGSAVTDWIAYPSTGKSGSHSIYLVVDPMNAIDETSKFNNTAAASLTVTGRADLLVQDIQFTPVSPEEGDSVQIKAVVKNAGSVVSGSTKLRFYLGDPANGGQQIGVDVAVGGVNPNATVTTGTIAFNTADRLGANGIYAAIDAANAADEINETNNTLNKTLTVLASTRPDFTISSENISFDPAQPVSGGTVTITAVIRNLRDTAAANVGVNFYDGDPAAGGILLGGTSLPAIDGMGTGQAAFAWNLADITGKHALFVKADPAAAIAETNETNNAASAAVKVRLPQGAAPVNLTAAAGAATAIDLAWEPGADEAAFGITGYNIYRNGLWVNSLRDIAKEGTAAASSSYSTYTPEKATDGNIYTYWYANYNAPAPQWWSDTFAAGPRPIRKVVVYWSTPYYGKNFEVQTWDGTQWISRSTVTGNTKEITVHEFASPVATDQVRIYITTGNYTTYAGVIREVKIYEDRMETDRAYQDAGLGGGTFTYTVTGVNSEGVETLPSNTASASLGDTVPPAVPTGLTASSSGFTINTAWNANSEADLAGYRLYRDGINVAQRERGAWAQGTNGASFELMIDGYTSTTGYTQWDTATPGVVTISLPKVYGINKIKMLLYDSGDARFYRYRIESSSDGLAWQVIEDKTAGEWRGWQEVVFEQALQARYFRITGSFASADSYFRIAEFEAYAAEPAQKTLDTYSGLGLNISNYANFYEWTYDWNPGTSLARKFIFSSFNVEEKDVLAVYDKTNNTLLATYTGNLGSFITQPLVASNYRFQFIADYEGTAPGFSIAGYTAPGSQTGRTSSETIYQNGAYRYAVTAIDKSGNESVLSAIASAVVADTASPAVPRNLAATAGNGSVNLTWTANTESDIAGYNLYRNDDPAPLNGAALLKTASYKDQTVVNLATYSYRVAAIDVNGNISAKSAAVNAVPTGVELVVAAADVSFRPRFPSVFDDISVFAVVHNTGTDSLPYPVQATLYVGNPSAGGIAAATATISSLPAGDATMVTFSWNPAGYVGTNTLYVVIDSTNALPEQSKTNNTANAAITVNPEPMLNVKVTSVDSRSFPEINAFVRVGDWAGEGIFSLTKDNFTVTEDGTTESPINVTLLNAAGHKPLVDIVFVFDDTGSMGGIITGLKQKVVDFAHKLTASNLDYFLGLVTFKDNVTVINNGYLTGNDNTFVSWVNALYASGGGDGPEVSLDGLNSAMGMHFRPGSEKVFVLITDAPPHVQGDGTPYSHETLAGIKQKLVEAGIITFVVGPDLQGTYSGEGGIAKTTNGKYYNVNTDDFTSIVDDLATAIASMLGDYKITYTTHNPARDGTLRTAVIEALYRYVAGTGSGQYRAPADSLADITLQSLSLSDPDPVAGETVTLTAAIANLGGAGAGNVLVRFYDGDPSYGIQLGPDQVLSGLSAAAKAELSTDWRATAGTHVITVVADPLNSVTESNEGNNSGTQTVIVPGTGLPELGLTAGDISVSKPVPSRGETITVQATIHNTGADAGRHIVLTYLGDPKNGGVQIGGTTLSGLAGNSTARIETAWPVDVTSGIYDIFVWVDPYDEITEGNENDNIAHRSVTVAEKAVSVSVTTDKASYPAAADVSIQAAVRNDAPVPWTGAGTISIEDEAGNRVASVSAFTVTDVKPAGLPGWAYRIPVALTAPWNLRNALASVSLDFGPVLSSLGIAGAAVDQNSIRVLEFDPAGNLLGEKQSRSLFQTASGADVTWLVDGTTAKDAVRNFYLYFDTTDHGAKDPSLNTHLPSTGRLIAYSDDTGNLSVVESNGDGTFGTSRLVADVSTAYDYTRGIVLRDFNNDGFMDIVSGSGSNGEIYYYQNAADGSNTFAAKVKVGTISSGSYIMDMAASDFNKDGSMDFAVSGNAYSQLYLFKGNGDGTFTQSTLPVPAGYTYFRGKTAADVDRDGNMDLIVGTSGTGLYLYRGNGDGTFKTPVQFSTAGSDSVGVVSGDFNSDGKADVIVNRSSSGDAYLLTGNGDGTFNTAVLVPSLDTNNYSALDTGDFDNDGILDVIAATYTTRTILFFPGKGDGTFGAKTTIATAASTYPLGISASPALPELHPVPGSGEPVPSRIVTAVWNTGTTPPGSYKARVTLTEGAGIIAEGSGVFAVQPDARMDSRITTDKISYNPREAVTLNATVSSLSLNTAFTNLTARIAITNPDGEVLSTESRTISALLPGGFISYKSFWNTGANPAGSYPATLEVRDAGGTLLSTSSGTIVINSTFKPTALLKGQIAVDRQSVLSGEPVAATYSVSNIGNADLANVNLSIVTVNVAEQAAYGTITDATALAMAGTYTHAGTIDTAGYTAKDYLVILRANIDGVEEKLASCYFRVEGAPSAPALLAPPNGSDVDTVTPMLAVSNASDPNDDRLTYEFELYSEAGLSNLVAASGVVSETTGSTAWLETVALRENASYYWRSRAYDGKLYGPWMETASFRVNTVNDPPSAPLPTSPADGTSVAALRPVLTVQNASDPDSVNLTYNFIVALDPGFAQVVASTTGIAEGTGSTSWQVPADLTENTWYYWRAQADDWQVEGPWSTTSSFFVNTANEAPSTPVIISPANGAKIAEHAADIVLNNSVDPDSPALSYYFELDTTTTFDSAGIVRSGVVAGGQGTTTWPVDGLQENTRYYVRAKASDGVSESAWSSVVWFFVNATNDPPAPPVLNNPSNGAGVVEFTPTLSVFNSADPDLDALTYEFEVFSDAALSTLVSGTTGVAEAAQITAWTVPLQLTENQTYYWRARAFDGNLYSGWMATASFTVNTANDAPGAPSLYSPADGSTVGTLTPMLAVYNAADPDGRNLVYDFELYTGGALIASVTGVAEGGSGITETALGAALSDNTVYQWRARAFDGDRYGPWMNMASFTVHIPLASIKVEIEFEPETLNQKSSGKWVKVEIELPHGYKASDIDLSSIRLEGVVPAEPWPYQIHDRHHKDCEDSREGHDHSELTIKFRRSDVIAVLPAGNNVPVHVSGKVGTVMFEGVDIIRVIH